MAGMAMHLRTLFLVSVMMSASLSGCFGEQKIDDGGIEAPYDVYPEPWDRTEMKYDDSDVFARVTINGSYGIDQVRSVFVPVPSITAADGGAGLTGGAEVHLGLWLPVIEGCDWESGNVSEECQVPVIAEVGPYYNDGDVDALTPADRLGRMLIENYVPHGYGVAQVSVFGTGDSNHCMDLMGTDEQRGIDAAVTWLGTQGWSNGKVGLIGKSYDGSNPLASSNIRQPSLSLQLFQCLGLIGVHELMWRNGSMEARGMIMHNGVYGSFGVDGDGGRCPKTTSAKVTSKATQMDLQPTCQVAWLTTLAMTTGPLALFLGRVVENYNGSVYIIQGMQDWNVDPHMAFPTHQIVEDAGLEVRDASWSMGARLSRPTHRPRISSIWRGC